MSNILDYVRTYGHETFAERPFCSADALVLAQLSYMDWSSAVPCIKNNGEFIRLHDTLYVGDLEPMIRGSVFKEGNRALFYQTANSKRFGSLKLNFYAEIWNEERNMQMAAITFLLPDGRACVTFRGTDESLNGWRESFSIVYRFPIAAQEYAAVYLRQVAALVDGPLIICGHSKGGNLAVYASANCKIKIQKRIRRIYNFDGPGFPEEFFKGEGYSNIASKIRKYVAPESFIGLLLKDKANTFMVECKAHGMEQHDPYQWELFGPRLRKACKYRKERRESGYKLNKQIMSVSGEKAGRVIEGFFTAVTDVGLNKLPELNADYALAVLRNFHQNGGYDKESVIVLGKMLLYMLPGRKILR